MCLTDYFLFILFMKKYPTLCNWMDNRHRNKCADILASIFLRQYMINYWIN